MSWKLLAPLTLLLLQSGCASQSLYSKDPIWVSRSINGLQQSPCNCGGVALKKDMKKQQHRDAKKSKRMTSQFQDGEK